MYLCILLGTRRGHRPEGVPVLVSHPLRTPKYTLVGSLVSTELEQTELGFKDRAVPTAWWTGIFSINHCTRLLKCEQNFSWSVLTSPEFPSLHFHYFLLDPKGFSHYIILYYSLQAYFIQVAFQSNRFLECESHWWASAKWPCAVYWRCISSSERLPCLLVPRSYAPTRSRFQGLVIWGPALSPPSSSFVDIQAGECFV